MANTLAYAVLFQQNLDKAAIQQARTGWMEANAGKVIYKGGKEIKIPKLSMQGLGDYDRSNGFVGGDVTFEYETKQMTHDRGRAFSIDENDVDETNFVVTASTIMGEFQRTKVVPEIDATRIAALATMAMGVSGDTQVEYGYTPSKATIVDKIKAGIKTIREAGFEGDLVCYVTYDAAMLVSQFYGDKLAAATFAIGGVDTRVPAIDGVPLVEMTSNKMVTKLKFNDGKSGGQEKGGFEKDSKGLDLNFLIVAKEAPIAVQKTDNMRIFDPNTNQKARAWAMDYRKFHDIWVPDNKLNGLFANIKDSKPLS
ncbi:hypothetical protein HF846_15755 [Clostridium cadaveris]|uniref:Prophage protein n=1 Tax=Clostridium cadaveris TaxID=1529 RepID=A0A316M6A3_9CLOT|nr:hypothetical protein [Clostridium cadaveris]NME66043.1 hypothetical protein [Clostridium cadaveris]PWL53754.1 MAG: hypothetical protein DBY38_06670 [Clostridium cadaveris]